MVFFYREWETDIPSSGCFRLLIMPWPETPPCLLSLTTNETVDVAFPIHEQGRPVGIIYLSGLKYLHFSYGLTSPLLWLRMQHHYCIRRVPY